MSPILTQDFFARDALEICPQLIGCVLCRRFENGEVFKGVISEVEAYLQDDPACHAFRGETQRNSVMFGDAGIAYIYFIYGMYFCLNVVTGHKGDGQAILFRGVIPFDKGGLQKDKIKFTNGPGKLCRHLEINKTHNGLVFSKKNGLWIEDRTASPISDVNLHVTPRIGISQAKEHLWRWVLKI